MTIYQRTIGAILYGGGSDLPVPLFPLDAAATLDEGWSPYAQASMVIKTPAPSVMARLSNLGARPRIVLRFESRFASFATNPTPVVREFDLVIVARQVFPKDGTVGLSLASDEAVLQDFAHTGLTADTDMRAYQFSVRNLVQYVMNRALTTNAIVEFNDFDFTTYYSATNLWPFLPGTAAEKYIPGTNAVIGAGSFGFRVFPSPTGSSNDSYGELPVQLTPGKRYTVSATINPLAVQQGTLHERARRVAVVITQAGVPRVLALTPVTPNTVGTRTVRVTFTIPENSTDVRVRLYNGQPAGGGGAAVQYTNMLIMEGDARTPEGFVEQYFDGNSAANVGYTYAWDGDPGLSSSTRTPRLNRSPEILTWKPGQTAWDFLAPILEASGLRFWCDELRRWHLTTADYSVPGTVNARYARELYEATDLMSRTARQSDGVPLYVDAMVVRYTWIDDKGNDRERYDVATTAGATKPYIVERPETPFPGVGAATYLLRRYMMRRRQIPVTAALDLKATPGMAVAISTSTTESFTGYLDAVTFDMEDDVMSLRAKNLV